MPQIEMDVDIENEADLDQKLARSTTAEDADDDADEEATDAEEALITARDTMRTAAVLLAYLGDASLCKTITQRERKIIDKHLDRLYDEIDKLGELLDE